MSEPAYGMPAGIKKGEAMSYKLEKPYTEEEYADFVVEHNHNNGRQIEETESAVYALEANERLGEDGVPDINPNYDAECAQKARLNRIEEIKQELSELDKKRIRAMCEPSEYAKGVSWLEYYNGQAQTLRIELQNLEA